MESSGGTAFPRLGGLMGFAVGMLFGQVLFFAVVGVPLLLAGAVTEQAAAGSRAVAAVAALCLGLVVLMVVGSACGRRREIGRSVMLGMATPATVNAVLRVTQTWSGDVPTALVLLVGQAVVVGALLLSFEWTRGGIDAVASRAAEPVGDGERRA